MLGQVSFKLINHFYAPNIIENVAFGYIFVSLLMNAANEVHIEFSNPQINIKYGLHCQVRCIESLQNPSHSIDDFPYRIPVFLL